MNAFRQHPLLSQGIKSGKQALKAEHRALMIESRQRKVAFSLDFDAAMTDQYLMHKRWDYFLQTSLSGDDVHAVEIHAYRPTELLGKKNGTLAILGLVCPEGAEAIKSWTALVLGNAPRPDIAARFTAETRIRIARRLTLKDLTT